MTTQIALLRAVNVGKRKVSMAALRELHESLGHRDVVTYIQSGNVVFDATGRSAQIASELEAALRERFGFDIPVMLRTAAEMAKALAANPWAATAEDHTRVAIAFLRDAPPRPLELDQAPFAPEECLLVGREIHFSVPNGLGRAQLPDAVARALPDGLGTMRNLRTCQKLLELATR